MEIERKYLIHKLPDHLEAYPHRTLEQAYLCTEPVSAEMQMAVGFLGKRKIMFFTHHQTFGFVGQDVVISISADTDNRFGA